jgi:hypothetical protein
MINCALRLQTMKLFREKARVAALMLLIAAQEARRALIHLPPLSKIKIIYITGFRFVREPTSQIIFLFEKVDKSVTLLR